LNATDDLTIAFKQSATKIGAEITMVLAMSHGEEVDWEKVSAASAVDETGKAVVIKPFLKRAKLFSKKLVSIIHATSTPTSSAAPTSSTAPTSSATTFELP
jgi:hypothetical protein